MKERVEYIKKIVGKFRDELRSEIDRLRDLTKYDMEIVPSAKALPSRSADLEFLFTLFLDAFEGKPQTSSHMTANQMLAKLGSVESRLGRFLDDINQSIKSSNAIFCDFVFHLADAFEAAGGDLYPNDRGQLNEARQAFKAMRKTLLSALPPDCFRGQSEAAIDKMAQSTLKVRAEGKSPVALSLAQQGMRTNK